MICYYSLPTTTDWTGRDCESKNQPTLFSTVRHFAIATKQVTIEHLSACPAGLPAAWLQSVSACGEVSHGHTEPWPRPILTSPQSQGAYAFQFCSSPLLSSVVTRLSLTLECNPHPKWGRSPVIEDFPGIDPWLRKAMKLQIMPTASRSSLVGSQ